VARLVEQYEPDVVGMSVMTFQRRTAGRIADMVRTLRPDTKIVVGGYDPSLAYEDYAGMSIDYVVRGEGEVTFRELLRALETGSAVDSIAGLSHRNGNRWIHNPNRAVHRLEDEEIRLPNRSARVLKGYTTMGRSVDVIETSRGCTFDCSFCSIVAMRGRNFHTYSFDRVLADIRDARDHGAEVIFIVDDNVTLDVRRFEALCKAIIDAKLNGLDYSVQGMTSAIANNGETLAPLMRKAGFRYVFLGIENVLENDLAFFNAASKNMQRDRGKKIGNATLKAIEYLHRNKMFVIGGLILGSPDDTTESIETNLAFARRYVDWPYIQHPTPYPRTPMTKEFRDQGLIVNECLEEYDGTTAVVNTKHLSAEDVEYLRWKAERGMKTRHILPVFLHDPGFVVRNVSKMLKHTYRGSTWRTVLRLEDERKAFARYKELRHLEREYL
jgi:anaerobic magnesium-protoporphyrin IX monomethyl ester cyclase